jgi:hypothetical protein
LLAVLVSDPFPIAIPRRPSPRVPKPSIAATNQCISKNREIPIQERSLRKGRIGAETEDERYRRSLTNQI